MIMAINNNMPSLCLFCGDVMGRMTSKLPVLEGLALLWVLVSIALKRDMVEESKTNWPPVGVLHAFDHDPGGPVDMDISPPGTRPPSPPLLFVYLALPAGVSVFLNWMMACLRRILWTFMGGIFHIPLSRNIFIMPTTLLTSRKSEDL